MRNLSITVKIFAVFIITVILATFSFIHLLQKTYEQSLITQGRSLAQEIVMFRHWVANYGGVWSKNKYQQAYGYLMSFSTENGKLGAYDGEDIGTAGSTVFYLHNPALATRELSGLSEEKYGWMFRVVSDRYMAPQSKPDAFETKAIDAIKSSKRDEYWGWDGKYFRFTKAIYIKKGCLKCHGPEEQVSPELKKALIAKYGDRVPFGYKVGDLRGIISVKIVPPDILKLAMSFVDVWDVGAFLLAVILFWLFAKKVIIDPVERLTKAAHDISVGKLDVDIGVRGLDESKVKDEITKLAIAIERLRTSIKIAMERLKKR